MTVGSVTVGLCIFLLSAYVSYTLQIDHDTTASWIFLLTPLTLSILTFAPLVWPIRWTDMWKLTAVPQHVVGIVIASLLDDLLAYCVAFAFAFFFTSLVTLADSRGYVKYTVGTGFSVSSASLYGVLRVVSKRIVNEFDPIGRWFSLLFPFVMSSLETFVMAVSRNNQNYYSFSSSSFKFVVYSVLKASVFVTLPRVEDALATRRSERI